MPLSGLSWRPCVAGRSRLLSLPAVLGLLVVSCTFENAGEPPPRDGLYFPTALALGRANGGAGDPDYLYVVNSNFDRRFNAGSVLSIDLDALDAQLRARGPALDMVDGGTDAGLGDSVSEYPNCPGRDCIIESADVSRDWVIIGSLGRGAALSSDHGYLYIPTAVETGLTFIKVSDGELDCGQGHNRRCSDDHVAGDDRNAIARPVAVPNDPIAVAAGAFHDFIPEGVGTAPREYAVVAYRDGQVALFVHERGGSANPVLADVRPNLIRSLTGLGYDPATGYLYVTSSLNLPGSPKYLQRVGVLGDPAAPERSSIFRSDNLTLDGVSRGPTTWAAHFVPEEPDVDGSARSTGYVVSQVPNSLLRVHMSEENGDSVTVDRITPVASGASRMAYGVLRDPNSGRPLEVVVVSCFVERQSRIYIIEAQSGRALSIVPGFNGSFEVQVDELRSRLYVADFSASVIRIVDLSPLYEGKEAYIQATLGHPRVVEELQ